MSLEAGGTTSRIWGYLATGNYFDLLGVRAVMGRALGKAMTVFQTGTRSWF